LGYLDESGNLYYCGRASDLVRCKGRLFHTIPLEELFNQHPKVYRSAIIPWQDEVAVIVEPHPCFWPEGLVVEEFRQELKELAKQSPLTEPIEQIFFHRSLPVDGRHNAKICREQLALWAKSCTRKAS